MSRFDWTALFPLSMLGAWFFFLVVTAVLAVLDTSTPSPPPPPPPTHLTPPATCRGYTALLENGLYNLCDLDAFMARRA